jgi:DNA-binding transcriptional LysR family regulator
MELYHLRSFVAVANEGHLTRAAKHLYISQPAVSAHIKSLEEELGVALFTRTPQGMQLTKEGQLLRSHAEKSLSTVNELFQQARQLQNELTEPVKIGLNTDSDFLRIGDFFSIMAEHCPRLQFHLLQRPSWTVIDEVKAGQLDTGYIFGECSEPEIATLLLRTSNLRVAGPKKWQAQIEQAETWADIVALPWVWGSDCCTYYKVFSEILGEQSLNVQKVAITDEEATLKTLAASGAGLALLAEEEAFASEQEGKIVIWRKNVFQVDLSLVYLRKRETDPVIQAILNSMHVVWDLAESI